MKNKIIGIFICMLLLATTASVVTSVKNCGLNTMVLNQSITRMSKIATKVPTVESLKNSLIHLTVTSKSTPSNALVNWKQQAKLLASDGTEGDYFSSLGISLSGDTALIGAWADDDNGIDSGSTYVFTRNGGTWTEQAKLLASDGTAGDAFGWWVAIEGDTALIGASGDDMLKGSAYIFTRNGNTWTEQAKLVAADGAVGDQFGYSVYLSGNNAIIGANCDDDKGFDSGSAYIFTRIGTTWTQQAKLLASDGGAQDSFGGEVSISGDTALIGACFDDDNGFDSGSAYVFIRTDSTWTEQAKLHASDGTAGDYFSAYAVSISSDTAAIGAQGDDDNGIDSGSAYIFIRTGTIWTEQAKLLASGGAAQDYFGGSVSLSTDTILIGAGGDDDNGKNSGSAYVFTRKDANWYEEAKLLASDGSEEDIFGWNVALNNNTAFIGAYYDDDNGVDSGSAYMFVRDNQPPLPPTINGPNKGKPNIVYDYQFTLADDSSSNNCYLIVDWGDDTNTGWIGHYSSGEIATASHSWSEKGTYTVKAKVKNIFGAESEWGTLDVTIPRIKITNNIFLKRFFQNHPNIFPFLQKILNRFD